MPRGYAGKNDTPDQYFVCDACGQATYEIVSVTQRDIRLYRYAANGPFSRDGINYIIRRILKVGFDEHLLYLRPLPVEEEEQEGLTRSASGGMSGQR